MVDLDGVLSFPYGYGHGKEKRNTSFAAFDL